MTQTPLRILNLEPAGYSVQARRTLEALGEVTDGPLARSRLLDDVGAYDVLIVRLGHRIDREILDRARCLKVVVSATTGLDHIDLECAASRGIAVLSLRGEIDFLRGIPATAEHTWALLLALARGLPAAVQSVLAGEWDRDRFRGRQLARKRLGLLGLGRIGEQVARYGLAFGMQAAAYDPFRAGWIEGVEQAASLPALLARSEVLSIHVPLDGQTTGLIGEAELACLPPGALLVNTSRGRVLDEAALLRALESGRLGGAALDVLADEDPSGLGSSALVAYARRRPNLVITPHLGGATHESMAAAEVFMASKLKEYLERPA
jgi:D-3-phosphoglycerate dehydrogenase